MALAHQRLEVFPDNASTHALLGELYESAGHVEQARQHFALAVDCAPQNKDHADRLRRILHRGKDGTSIDTPNSTTTLGTTAQRYPVRIALNWVRMQAIWAQLPKQLSLTLLAVGAIIFTLAGLALGTIMMKRSPEIQKIRQQPTYPNFEQTAASLSQDAAIELEPKTPILGATATTTGSGEVDDDPIDLPGAENVQWNSDTHRLTFDVRVEVPKKDVQSQREDLRTTAFNCLDFAFTTEPDANESIVNLVSGTSNRVLLTLGATRKEVELAKSQKGASAPRLSLETWAKPFTN